MNKLSAYLQRRRSPGKIALPAGVRRAEDLQRTIFPHWTLLFTLKDGRQVALTLHGRTRYWGWSVPCDACMASEKGPAFCSSRPGCLDRPTPPQELVSLIETVLGGDPLQATLDAASWAEYLEAQERRLLTELKSRAQRMNASKAKVEALRNTVRAQTKAQLKLAKQHTRAVQEAQQRQRRNHRRAQEALARRAKGR